MLSSGQRSQEPSGAEKANTCKMCVFTAATMKNVVAWDIKYSSYLTGDTLLLRYRAQPVNAM
jgi:hypothetical protein